VYAELRHSSRSPPLSSVVGRLRVPHCTKFVGPTDRNACLIEFPAKKYRARVCQKRVRERCLIGARGTICVCQQSFAALCCLIGAVGYFGSFEIVAAEGHA
jgi:hypothetical protein